RSGQGAGIVTTVARRHMSAGVVAQALARLPAGLRELLEPPAAQPAGRKQSLTTGRWHSTSRACGRAAGAPGWLGGQGGAAHWVLVRGGKVMADARTVQVRAETRGAVPEGAASYAVHQVSSLLRTAPEPVLSARVKLIMAADPAVERPAIAQLSI